MYFASLLTFSWNNYFPSLAFIHWYSYWQAVTATLLTVVIPDQTPSISFHMTRLPIPWRLTRPLSRPSSLTPMTYMPCSQCIRNFPSTVYNDTPIFHSLHKRHLSDPSKIPFVFQAGKLPHDSKVSRHPPPLPWCIKFLLVLMLLHCKLFTINHPSIILILRVIPSSVRCSARQIMSPSFNISKLHQ